MKSFFFFQRIFTTDIAYTVSKKEIFGKNIASWRMIRRFLRYLTITRKYWLPHFAKNTISTHKTFSTSFHHLPPPLLLPQNATWQEDVPRELFWNKRNAVCGSSINISTVESRKTREGRRRVVSKKERERETEGKEKKEITEFPLHQGYSHWLSWAFTFPA